MVDAVMDDAQDTWQQLLGGRYQDTKAVLFRDAINSACGFAQSATGPFYCPADHKVYLDLGFFDELQRKLRRARRFRAGLRARPRARPPRADADSASKAQVRQRAVGRSRSARNALSVRMELQADCFAGVWGYHANKGGSAGCSSIRTTSTKALNAAAAIGDDRLQRMQGGRVAPERFTHGTSRAARRLVPPRLRERRSERLQYVPVTQSRATSLRHELPRRRDVHADESHGTARHVAPAPARALARSTWHVARRTWHVARSLAHARDRRVRSPQRRTPQGHRRRRATSTTWRCRACCTASPSAARRRAASSAASSSSRASPGTSSSSSPPPTFPARNVVALIVDDQPYLARETHQPSGRAGRPPRPSRPAPARRGAPARRDRRRAAAGGLHDRRVARAAARSSGARDNVFKSYLVARGDVDAAFARRRRHRRGRVRDRRAGAALHRAERHAGRRGSAGRRDGLGLDAVPLLHSQGARRAVQPAVRAAFASCRWRPAAGSAARRNIRRSSPATPRCSRGSPAGR